MVVVMERDLEPRVARLEETQKAWLILAGDLQRAFNTQDRRLERMETDITGLRSDVAGLRSDVAGLKTDVADLKTDVAGLKTDVALLKTDVADLKTDVAGLKTEVIDIKGQLNRFELSSEQRFNRLDARMEQLFGIIARREKGGEGTGAAGVKA